MMNNTIIFSLPGTPQPKKRPRFAKCGKRHRGRVKVYSSQAEDEKTVKWQLKARMVGRKPFAGPLEVHFSFFMPIPKSVSKKVYAAALTGDHKHVKTPDIDNLVKYYLDCMNKVVYNDDSQVYKIAAVKRYSTSPRTEITIVNNN